jgi:uncharacterized membrane protein YvbJ
MRSRQILPIALLALFAIGIFLAIALVQMAKNKANQDYMAEEAIIADLHKNIDDTYMWVDHDEKAFAKRMKALEERHEQAVKERETAFAVAYSRQGYIIYAGIFLFVVFVAVTIYMGRKSADSPQA